MKTINILLVLLMTFSFAANAHGDKNKDKGLFKGIDTPAAKVVLAFHQALETGNQKQARAQLADDVTIFEGGRVERSADEYAHHHMLSDMKYLAAMKSDTLEHQVTILGNTMVKNVIIKGWKQWFSKSKTVNGKLSTFIGHTNLLVKPRRVK